MNSVKNSGGNNEGYLNFELSWLEKGSKVRTYISAAYKQNSLYFNQLSAGKAVSSINDNEHVLKNYKAYPTTSLI